MFKKISGVNKEQAVHNLKLWATCFFQYFSNRKLSRIIQFVERTTNTLDENEQEEEKAMQTSVIGFPRIGTLRELKFASEKYFRNEIKAEELLQTAKDLRKAHWMTQKEAGITFISSNDFSHYDLVLDTAVLLGIVPKRYQELQLSALDTYFAMARGYQGTSGDVKALAMKKWFNTNYHYIVPEAEDDTVIHLSASKLFDEYAEAKELGIATKPVVIGAYTMLKLCRFTGEKKAEDFIGDLTAMDFDGIGLDFLEGKETVRLIEAYGFPADKILFAGLVNGKNIWKNHYEKTLQTVKGLQEKNISVVLSTSCSLLHVPYTLKHETKLPKECSAYFAFAEEKLTELQELGVLADLADYIKAESYQNNHRLFAEKRDCENDGVRERLSRITEQDAVRLPKRSERQKLQKAEFGLPEFPATTIGSFPQTRDVKANRSAYRKGEKTKEEYEAFNRAKIAECVAWQEEIGLDVLVHGEYERNDMVEYFGEALGGFLFTEKGWVQSYGTRCVKPPVIWGDVYRKSPITVAWSVYAQSLTKKIMKGMLSGPVTILNWSFPREDISIRESISQIALAIRDEVLDLEANGIRMIQIDEAALREKLPLRKSDWYSEYLDFAIPAFRLTHSGVEAETQIHTHMCYSEFTDIIPAIDDMDADVITFEASRSDLQILDSLRENHFETEVGPGVYDIHSPRVPSVEEMVQSLTVMLTKIPKEKLWVNPDCGLKTRGVPEADASLRNMVKAAEEIRKKFS